MKMGTIASPGSYDAAARHALLSGNIRRPAPALRLMGGCLCDFAGWSGYNSMAAFLIEAGIDVMCQERRPEFIKAALPHVKT
jgi:hypothetical protein